MRPRNISSMVFFDDKANTCNSFLFHGCDGNANNFLSRQTCMEYCSRPELSCPSGEAFLRHPNGEIVECHMFQAEKAVQYCCSTQRHICQQRPDRGDDCGQSILRYSFNPDTQQCQSLLFHGCGGNSNNFASAEVCNNFCLSAGRTNCSLTDPNRSLGTLVNGDFSACAVSESVFISASAGSALDCSRTPCPLGYTCVPDAWNTTKMICCGTSHHDACPDGFLPFFSYRSPLPMTCRSNGQNVCPLGFHCLFNTAKRRHYCCREKKNKESCPFGSRLVRLRTGDPFGCNSDSHCPAQATCHKIDDYQSGICCKPVYKSVHLIHDSDGTREHASDCPPTHELDGRSVAGIQCSPLDPRSCISTNAFCSFSQTLQRFVCCRERITTSDDLECPSEGGESARRVFCSAEVPCPPLHICIRRHSERNGFCCPHTNHQDGETHENATKRKCIVNSTALVLSSAGDDELQPCNAEQRPCAHPHQCSESRPNNALHERLPDSKRLYCASGDCHLPNQPIMCTGAMDVGRKCRDSKPSLRYFYDSTALSCRQFLYFGCDGNGNNFSDETSCEAACAITTTPAHQIDTNDLRCPDPFFNPPKWPQKCGDTTNFKCNGTCVSLPNALRVCCIPPSLFPPRSSHFELCGNGLKPIIYSPSGRQLHCSTHEDCNGETCSVHSASMTGICCESNGGNTEKKSRTSFSTVQRLTSNAVCSALRPCKGQSVCLDGRCVCRPGQVLFRQMCYWKCPPDYQNVNGVCIGDHRP
uniref:Kunitz/Bovine pancreatic trypsin inhibitor domain protein n=1 Tax=Haemonchus contortus TaxID=6289 RepID=A0A7I4YCK1_HAECO